jgi:hypothetical protein
VLQNDFAARADWCVLPYEEANHAPVITLDHPNSLRAKPGTVVKLNGFAKDPDGDTLNYKWWQYWEVDTYSGEIKIKEPKNSSISLLIPSDAKAGETIHLIFEASDSGTPKLTRYQRVIITIK